MEVSVFEFAEQFLSLATNPILTAAENFVADAINPYADPPEKVKGEECESHNGKRYKEISAHFKATAGENDIMLPIIIYIDKTHVDRRGQFTIEPVMFTLSLFKEKARRNHRIWRVLGYVTNTDLVISKAEKKEI